MNKKFVPTFGALLSVLLLTSTVFAAPAVANVGVPFKGSLQALEIGAPDVTASGSGNATHLGRFTYSYTVTISPTGNVGEAVGILYYHFVAANGDSLYSTGDGIGGPTESPNTFRIVEIHTITGGTGRFAGATGSFNVERLILQPEGITWGTFDGSIVLAKNN